MHERIKPDGTVVAAGSINTAAEAKLKSATKKRAASKDEESKAETKSEPAKPEPAKEPETKSEPPKPAAKSTS